MKKYYSESQREENLIEIMPKNRRSVLEIGARAGYFTRILTQYFESITALDLDRPQFEIDNVRTCAGDVQKLQFPDASFDCVVCTEVLEHVPKLEQAAAEVARVARHEIVIGVPYRQDTRVSQTYCSSCGKNNPPWGHINTFDEDRLRQLFPQHRAEKICLIGSSKARTNAVADWFLNEAHHPWGSYNQEEPCIHCHRKLTPPTGLSPYRKLCGSVGGRLVRLQQAVNRPHPGWIHVVFSKPGS